MRVKLGIRSGASARQPAGVAAQLAHGLPANADQAALMALLGTQWLEQHAPERLKAPADAGQAQAPADVEPSAQEQKLAERLNWTTKQWYEHVGAWEDGKDQIVFGTVMALRAMLVQFQAVTLYAAERRAAPVPAAAPEALQGCEWTHDEPQYSWDSACGEKWSFIEGGPKENFVRFCQGCGKPVVLAAAPVGGA